VLMGPSEGFFRRFWGFGAHGGAACGLLRPEMQALAADGCP